MEKGEGIQDEEGTYPGLTEKQIEEATINGSIVHSFPTIETRCFLLIAGDIFANSFIDITFHLKSLGVFLITFQLS